MANDIGKRAREARQDRHLTLEALAERVPCSVSHLNDIEHGRRKPSVEMAARLAKALGVSTDYLLGLSDEPSPTPPSGTVRTAAAHAKPPPPGVDLAEWERRARQRLEELIEEVRRDLEETQRKGR